MKKAIIGSLFANDINRRIEEVIKVDQTAEDVLQQEIDEYVVTGAIKRHYEQVLDLFAQTPNKPHEGTAVWVSGFFGSGKSSFAKILGLALSGKIVAGKSASERFAERAGDPKLTVLLKQIAERIPTHAVIFDVSTDRGIKSGNQTLTEIMYGLFLQSLGYAKDLDLSELEIALEEQGKLEQFKKTYGKTFGKVWDEEKGKVAFALSEASRVLQEMDPKTYPSADSWAKAARNRADITAGKLAERCTELMKRRHPGKTLVFVVDEVGQFVARDVQKMLDLQGAVQNLGVKGRGKHWLVITSQEKLGEIVSGLDDKRIELARLMDRFPTQVHLEPSDISEVTSRRVLSKNAAAESILGKLFDDHRGRLTAHTRITADVKMPELNRQGFIDLYPLLPYQIDLVIQVVSGLRTQGGVSRHVGGANRTIIKLAQQLLINPSTKIAEHEVKNLVRLDQVYDLVESNIGSEVRAKINVIPKEVDHEMAQRVAKAICLLQYVRSVHRTPENIAAALHPSVDADSQLPQVKEALQKLEAAHKIRHGDDGYRIPTPAEDDWERTRMSLAPRQGDAQRIHADVINSFWQPQPSHVLHETRTFKAGLALHGRPLVDGDLLFNLYLADSGKEFDGLAKELRARSQQEKSTVFWAVSLDDGIEHQTVEVYRSKEVLARKEREAKTQDELALIGEERGRLKRHEGELRRLLRDACLAGSAFFRGNDRSPTESVKDVGKAAAEILATSLPQVFERFKEAAAKSSDLKKGLDALFTADNLQGLPPVFSSIGLLRDEKGKVVFNVDAGPLSAILNKIEERANYGDTASGRLLADEFGKEPFGWDFEAVRLFVLSLMRAGKIEATSKGHSFDSATSLEAKDAFSGNNPFRQCAFRPKKGIEFEQLVKAAEAYRDTFGSEVKELNAGSIVAEIRKEVAKHEDVLALMAGVLAANKLPGGGVLETALGQMKGIIRGSEEQALSTFNASHRSIKDATKRAAELEQALTEPRLRDLERAREATQVFWPFLDQEADLPADLRTKATALVDLLAKETFFRDLPSIEQYSNALETEYARRHAEATKARISAYVDALNHLTAIPSWAKLEETQRSRVSAPLQRGTSVQANAPVLQLRSELDACGSRLSAAIADVHRLTEGDRVVTVQLGKFFTGGVETPEQLEAAIDALRSELSHHIGAGRKVLVQ